MRRAHRGPVAAQGRDDAGRPGDHHARVRRAALHRESLGGRDRAIAEPAERAGREVRREHRHAEALRAPIAGLLGERDAAHDILERFDRIRRRQEARDHPVRGDQHLVDRTNATWRRNQPAGRDASGAQRRDRAARRARLAAAGEHVVEQGQAALDLAELDVRLGRAHAPAIAVGLAGEDLELGRRSGELAAEEQRVGSLGANVAITGNLERAPVPVGGERPRELGARGVAGGDRPSGGGRGVTGLAPVIGELVGGGAIALPPCGEPPVDRSADLGRERGVRRVAQALVIERVDRIAARRRGRANDPAVFEPAQHRLELRRRQLGERAQLLERRGRAGKRRDVSDRALVRREPIEAARLGVAWIGDIGVGELAADQLGEVRRSGRQPRGGDQSLARCVRRDLGDQRDELVVRHHGEVDDARGRAQPIEQRDQRRRDRIGRPRRDDRERAGDALDEQREQLEAVVVSPLQIIDHQQAVDWWPRLGRRGRPRTQHRAK
jgi:hypothetical protein